MVGHSSHLLVLLLMMLLVVVMLLVDSESMLRLMTSWLLLLVQFVHVHRGRLEENRRVHRLRDVMLELRHGVLHLHVSSKVVVDEGILLLAESFIVSVEVLLLLLMLLWELLTMLLVAEIRCDLLDESTAEDVWILVVLKVLLRLRLRLWLWLRHWRRRVLLMRSEVRRWPLVGRELLAVWERSRVERLSGSVE